LNYIRRDWGGVPLRKNQRKKQPKEMMSSKKKKKWNVERQKKAK